MAMVRIRVCINCGLKQKLEKYLKNICCLAQNMKRQIRERLKIQHCSIVKCGIFKQKSEDDICKFKYHDATLDESLNQNLIVHIPIFYLKNIEDDIQLIMPISVLLSSVLYALPQFLLDTQMCVVCVVSSETFTSLNFLHP